MSRPDMSEERDRINIFPYYEPRYLKIFTESSPAPIQSVSCNVSRCVICLSVTSIEFFKILVTSIRLKILHGMDYFRNINVAVNIFVNQNIMKWFKSYSFFSGVEVFFLFIMNFFLGCYPTILKIPETN